MSILKRQHEGFATFFENPRKDYLRELVKDNLGETDYLDFKESWIEYSKLAKHILALANSGGGVVVFGIKENGDGTNNPKGLKKLNDKSDISKKLSKYLPSIIIWEVFDFSYDESEYQKLIGKKFQVLMVEYNPECIPVLAKCAGENIKNNAIYIRDQTNTTEANHDALQTLLNRRIKSNRANKAIALSEHLLQLKELYKASNSYTLSIYGLDNLTGYFNNPAYSKYEDFIKELVEEKKQVIRMSIGIKGSSDQH